MGLGESRTQRPTRSEVASGPRGCRVEMRGRFAKTALPRYPLWTAQSRRGAGVEPGRGVEGVYDLHVGNRVGQRGEDGLPPQDRRTEGVELEVVGRPVGERLSRGSRWPW